MAEKEPNRYPSNQAYIGANSSSNRSSNPPKEHSSSESMRASVLAGRVQELEDQLVSIATALNEDGKENQIWQEQLMKEHREVSELLAKREEEVSSLEKELEASQQEKQLLRDSLFRQNEEFETLHKELQEARAHNSRITSKELEEKVLELNDQISTLLVKIQQMVEENNQLISYNEELEKAVGEYKANQELYETEIQRLNDQNNYLKEEIKEVQTLAIAQQTETQDRYLQQLQQAKVHIQELKKSHHEIKQPENSPKTNTHTTNQESRSLNKENAKLRAEIHSLEEQLMQQREFQRSIKKKYEERLLASQAEAQKLADEISRLKMANRNLQRLTADQNFALQQLQVQKKNPEKARLQNQQHYKNIIIRLQSQKQELALKVAKAQIQTKYEQSTQFYSSLLKESDIQIQRLKDELMVSEEQLAKSRRSVREFSQLAKRWEEDYRKLSQDYEDAFVARRRIEEKTKMEQMQLQKHKQKYEQLVSKCDQSTLQYKQLEEKLKFYEQSKAKPLLYDKQSSDLVKLQNSMLKQQIAQLKQSLEQHSSELFRKDSKLQDDYLRQMKTHFQRERQLQRLVQMLRNRLAAESNSTKETDITKIRQLTDQLARVNKMLNQRQQELDSFKSKYADLQNYLRKRQQTSGVTKHHPQYTRLKNEFVALQRKLMETEVHYKNSLQNAEFEIQSLKVQNVHHRKKIEDLLLQLSKQHNSLDYNKINRSLQLSQLKIKELEKELEVSQLRVKELNQQLRIKESRARKASENVLPQQDYSINQKMLPYNQQLSKDLQPQNSAKDKNYTQKGVLSHQVQNFSSPAYDELLKWRQEVRQSRSNFSKKWVNQFSAQRNQVPRVYYPLHQMISS